MYGADNDVNESDGANGNDDGINFENDMNRSTVSPGTCTVDKQATSGVLQDVSDQRYFEKYSRSNKSVC